jgi:hypothetical protein
VNARNAHSATLLPSGQVLVADGTGNSGYLSSLEVFNPSSQTWTGPGPGWWNTPRANHTATLLAGGAVLIAGGYNGSFLSEADLYDSVIGTNTVTGSLNIARADQTATLLTNGMVLVAGGYNYNSDNADNSAELYNPATGTWIMTNSMNTARYGQTATLLTDGLVLVAGGNGATTSAELYSNGTWLVTGSMNVGHERHTATLLTNGKVLVAGGEYIDDDFVINAELYSNGTWLVTGALNFPRSEHTATLLPNGKVLIAGGQGAAPLGGDPLTLSSAELYDPATGMWTMTGSLNTARHNHTATLLPNGKVLVAGGLNSSIYAADSIYATYAELYDPVAGTWTNTGALNFPRYYHTATLLPDGKVLVAGGSPIINGNELYNPANGLWTTTRPLNTPRYSHTATLLPDGQVLIAGGDNGSPSFLTNAELIGVSPSSVSFPKPQVATVTSPISPGGVLVVTGAQFRGIAEGSGGNTQDSSTDYPLVQLRSVEGGQTVFLSSTNWATNTFASTAVWNFPPGWALATVFVNGIQSTSSIVNVSVPVPAMTTLAVAPTSVGGSFQFSFTNNPGALLGVLMTTNLSLPVAGWTRLGGVTEISPGQFQFNDPQATNGGQRFYSLFAP